MSRFAALALFLSACAHSGGMAQQLARSNFPRQSELEELSKRETPPAAQLFGDNTDDAESWEMQGPLPNTIGTQPSTAKGGLADALTAAAGAKLGLVAVDEAMNCVARETARFHLAHHKLPGDSVRVFITGRCGATVAGVEAFSLFGDVPGDVSEAKLLETWKPQLAELVQNAVGSGTRLVGVGMARDEKKVVFIAAGGRRLAHLAPVSALPAGGFVEVKGELLTPAQKVEAAITYGRWEARQCEATGVAPPAFSFRCPVNGADELAYVQVLAIPAGRILGHVVATLLVRPSGAAVSVYKRPKQAVASLSGDTQSEGNVTARVLNDLRTAAGLPALTVAPAQSELARALAPHYFAAGRGSDETVADMVVLGLEAGWQVDGLVHHGAFAAAMVFGTTDLGRLMSNALEMPLPRRALLDPEATRLAVGVIAIPDGRGVAGVFTTYRELKPADHEQLVAQVLDALNAARAKNGLPAAKVLHELDVEAATVANGIERGLVTPEEASNQLMRAAVNVTRKSVRGWTFAGGVAADMPFSDELLQNADLTVAPAVAIVRYPGQAWATYLVVLVEVVRGDVSA